MRLFLALFPHKSIQTYCRDVLRKLELEKRNLIPMSLEQLHFTLRFIGPEVSESSMELIKYQLEKFDNQWPKAELQVEEVSMGSGYESYPKALMANLALTPSVKELMQNCHALIKGLELEDTVKFKPIDDLPHITIARVKPNAGPKLARRIREAVNEIELETPGPELVSDLWLVKSSLANSGPQYQKLLRLQLR